MAILVTGGTGYIGSHTTIELLNAGNDVVIVDNLCNSKRECVNRVEELTGKKVKFYECDIRDRAGLDKVFAENEHEAFYILTPHIMQSLLKLREELKAPILLVFSGGRLHIGVYNGKDAFEGKIFGKIDIEAEKARMLEDLKLITNFVDELSLERDIYKH